MTGPARPLAGRRIVVTRAREQAGDLVGALADLGADVVAAPAIRIVPLPDAELGPLRAALQALSRYRWVVFTSPNAARLVGERIRAWNVDPAAFARVAVAAIGPATAAALERRGIRPAVVPERFIAEGVVAALAARGDLRGARVLLPRAAEARDALPVGLRACGAVVDVVPVYRTERAVGDDARLAGELAAGWIDAVTFTSSSTVRRFVERVGAPAARSGRFVAAVIGPVTAATARELGIPVAVEAREYTVPGLVAALLHYFGARAPR